MVCDLWVCKHHERCREQYPEQKYPPCAMCPGFDKCSHCSKYIDCCDDVVHYLPDMFRRLVREIHNGEDTAKTEQAIRRRTKGKRY